MIRLPGPPPTYEAMWATQYTRALELTIQQLQTEITRLQLNIAPGYTSSDKVLIPNYQGQVIYDTTLNKLCVNTGSGWETVTSIP